MAGPCRAPLGGRSEQRGLAPGPPRCSGVSRIRPIPGVAPSRRRGVLPPRSPGSPIGGAVRAVASRHSRGSTPQQSPEQLALECQIGLLHHALVLRLVRDRVEGRGFRILGQFKVRWQFGAAPRSPWSRAGSTRGTTGTRCALRPPSRSSRQSWLRISVSRPRTASPPPGRGFSAASARSWSPSRGH